MISLFPFICVKTLSFVQMSNVKIGKEKKEQEKKERELVELPFTLNLKFLCEKFATLIENCYSLLSNLLFKDIINDFTLLNMITSLCSFLHVQF